MARAKDIAERSTGRVGTSIVRRHLPDFQAFLP
jgi:hypothetical protein